MSTYRTAIIGPEEVVSGFRALGVDTYYATTGTELLDTLVTMKRTQNAATAEDAIRYAVVIVTESLVTTLPSDDWERASRGVLPAIVVLPGIEGTSGQGIRKLKRLAERAVGSDILQ